MARHAGERDSHVREYVMIEQARLRRRMEAAVESMLAVLDELDGELDLEPAGDAAPGAVDDDGGDAGDDERSNTTRLCVSHAPVSGRRTPVEAAL